MYRAELVARHAGLRLDREIAPSVDQPSPRFRLLDGQVFALDQTLTAIASRKVGLSPGARILNGTRDLSLIVAADQADLVVIAAEEFRLPVPEAQAACLIRGGFLGGPVLGGPVLGGAVLGGAVLVAAQGERVLVIDADVGQVLDEVELDRLGYLSAIRHPAAPAAVVTAGQGQDGSRVYTVAEAGGRLSVTDLAEDVLGASFNPSGTRLLVTPHPTFASTLRVLRWPDGELLHAANASDLGLTGESFGVCGCYLDDDLVLAMTKAGRIVALDGQLGLRGEIGLAPDGRGPDFMIGLSAKEFAVQTWLDGAASASVWRLPPSLAS
jgi:hypothetical protein